MSGHLISTAAALVGCRRCARTVLEGYDGGQLIRADPAPLAPEDELLALLGGRHTYDLHLMGLPRRPYLIWRCTFRLRAPRRHQVVATHECTPTQHLNAGGPPINLIASYRKQPLPEKPPF